MKNKRKLISFWIILFIPILFSLLIILYHFFQEHREKTVDKFKKHIGKKFEITNLIDINENKVNLKYNTDIAIIDFWFKGCRPCIEEMKQFKSLISGYEKEFTIISISIDNVKKWKPLFSDNSDFPFLSKKVDNWIHYAFNNDTTTINTDSIDTKKNRANTLNKIKGANFLINTYGINSFPTYFVLDKNGIITDATDNGTDYIKEKFHNQHYVKTFLSKISNNKFKAGFFALFLIYSIFYWLIVWFILRLKK